MSVEIVTFGCRLNLVESEEMRRAAQAAGRSDLIIVNTCAVTSESVRQSRQAIRRLKREKPDSEIVVTGCAAETEREAFAAMPEVSTLVPNVSKTKPETWGATARLMAHSNAPAFEAHTRAFVEIQNGCDHRCTFCIIPYGRGVSRSKSPDDVVAQIRGHVDSGFKEAVLTGVDLTSWGEDLESAPKLGSLVRRILRDVPDLARLRLSSIDCIEADTDLMHALADEPRLMPHLHLSLQSGDDLILKRMKRRHLRADAIAFCQDAKRLRPDLVIGADLITGFPTESDAMFANTCALVQDCGLTHLHVFPFSPRPGTPAALMPQVPREVAKQRAEHLRILGDTARHAHLERQIGGTFQVLTERGGIGRTPDFTPVRIGDVPHGLMLDVKITSHNGRELVAG